MNPLLAKPISWHFFGPPTGLKAIYVGKYWLLVLAWLLVLCLTVPAAAKAGAELPRFIDSLSPGKVFPGADRIGEHRGSGSGACIPAR